MKCDFCDHQATVFLTQLVDGQMKKVCLCEPCAKERGVTDPTGFSMAELLLGGVPAMMGVGGGVESPMSQRRCGECGFTLDDLRRVRRFGCAECYRAFADEVSQMVRSMHKGTTHTGKVPEGLIAMQIRHQRVEELKARLDRAIAAESYEEAAGIRDELLSLTQVQA